MDIIGPLYKISNIKDQEETLIRINLKNSKTKEKNDEEIE